MAGKNLLKAWHRFIQTNFNAFKSGAPNLHKQRKYEHIEIQKDFEEIENKRQLQRLTLVEYKKKLKKQLVEQKLQVAKAQKLGLLGEDESLKEEVKRAEDIQKFGEFKTFKDYSQTIDTAKSRISEIKVSKESTDAMTQQLEQELAKLSSDIENIRVTKQELEKVDQDIEELEPNYILVTGLEKKLVLNTITYYEFQHRNLQGVIINPETLKAIETVHYHVEHNLPVRRELLYEVAPELFETEIGELQQYERERILAKRPRFENRNDAIVRAIEKPDARYEEVDELEELKKQEIDFMEFVYAKTGEFTNKHYEHLEDKIGLGFPTTEAVLENIENKPEEERTEAEKLLYDDLQELKRINNDYADLIKLNQVKAHAKQRELYVPDFVKQNDVLHKAWVQKWEELATNSFDLSESLLVPDNSATYESRLEKVLKDQRAVDINELIQQSQEEYKMNVTGPEPTKTVDRSKKDFQLLQKLDVLTGAMNQKPETRKVKQRDIEHYQNRIGHAETSEEGRILLDEMTKILYLNNKDSAKYNLIFWAEHFNIDPQKLRNIFNFVSFGLPDQKNPKDIGRVLRFIYDNSILTDEQKEQLGQAPSN